MTKIPKNDLFAIFYATLEKRKTESRRTLKNIRKNSSLGSYKAEAMTILYGGGGARRVRWVKFVGVDFIGRLGVDEIRAKINGRGNRARFRSTIFCRRITVARLSVCPPITLPPINKKHQRASCKQ